MLIMDLQPNGGPQMAVIRPILKAPPGPYTLPAEA